MRRLILNIGLTTQRGPRARAAMGLHKEPKKDPNPQESQVTYKKLALEKEARNLENRISKLRAWASKFRVLDTGRGPRSHIWTHTTGGKRDQIAFPAGVVGLNMAPGASAGAQNSKFRNPGSKFRNLVCKFRNFEFWWVSSFGGTFFAS